MAFTLAFADWLGCVFFLMPFAVTVGFGAGLLLALISSVAAAASSLAKARVVADVDLCIIVVCMLSQ